MNRSIGTFNYDAKGATLVRDESRTDKNGNTVKRLELDNGVVIVYTKTPTGVKNIDTNYELFKKSNGYYYSDLSSPKRDFHDYY